MIEVMMLGLVFLLGLGSVAAVIVILTLRYLKKIDR
jgi:hypothetical protein